MSTLTDFLDRLLGPAPQPIPIPVRQGGPRGPRR